jgi:thymidine phosphorylase
VDDEGKQPFDEESRAGEVVTLGGIGQSMECGLSEVLAAADADVAPSAGRALRS